MSRRSSATKEQVKTEPSSTEAFPGHAIGRYHEHVSEVIKVQVKIGTPPDGVFGPKTEATLIRWQAARGLETSGVVDQATWQLMFA